MQPDHDYIRVRKRQEPHSSFIVANVTSISGYLPIATLSYTPQTGFSTYKRNYNSIRLSSLTGTGACCGAEGNAS